MGTATMPRRRAVARRRSLDARGAGVRRAVRVGALAEDAMTYAYRFVAISSLLLPLAASCNGAGETLAPGGAGGTGTGGTGCVPPTHAEPPPLRPDAAPAGSGHVTFAVRTLLLGDQDRDGTPDPQNGWRSYGFDLDGMMSEKCAGGFAGLCRPRFNAGATYAHTDGADGIDNGFGKGVLPLILALVPDASQRVQADLDGGGPRLIVDLDGLGPGADQREITARLYVGASLGNAPAYDGGDVWPVWSSSLADPNDVGSAKLVATDSYVTGDTWVGRFQGVLTLRLPVAEHDPLVVPLRDPIVAMHLDAARASADSGTLAGVLSLDDTLQQADAMLARADATHCTGVLHDGIIADTGQAADILLDRTQDPAKDCDAISFGIGFTAARVVLGASVPEPPLPPALCGDAGAPGGG
jgi:hypothetical protein